MHEKNDLKMRETIDTYINLNCSCSKFFFSGIYKMSGEPDWQKCFICQKNLPRQPLKKLHVSWTYEQSLEFLKNVHGNMQKLKNHVHVPDNPIVFTSYTPEALYDNDPVYHRSCRLAVSDSQVERKIRQNYLPSPSRQIIDPHSIRKNFDKDLCVFCQWSKLTCKLQQQSCI